MQELDTRYGRMRVPDADDVIGRFLQVYGEWAWLESSFVAQVVPPGGRVLDVGAFVGTFGLGVARLTPLDLLCCVEANPRVAALLADNLHANCAGRVEVVPEAVAPEGTKLGAGSGQDGNLGSMSFAPGATGSSHAVPAGQTTLRELRERYGPFDLVKLDVEGLELALLQADAPVEGEVLWVECNDAPASLAIVNLLLQRGQPVQYFAWPSVNPGNHNRSPEVVFPFAYEAGLLAGAGALDLGEELVAAGCQLRTIHSVEDLRLALWLTPRWAPETWLGRTVPEVVALAAHHVLGHEYEQYLGDGWDASIGRQREVQLTEALDVAERLARTRLDELQEAREAVERLSRGLETAEALAVDRLAELQAVERRAQRSERSAAALQARLLQGLASTTPEPGSVPGAAGGAA